MARCIFENLTLEQAKTLADWYEGQGEQDADVWFDIQKVKTPYVNVQRKDGGITINGEDVTVYCK